MAKRPKRKTLLHVGRNIAKHREHAGLTQEQLAAAAGLSSVKMIESGKYTGSIQALIAIADVLGVPIGVLLANPAAPSPPELQAFLDSPLGRDASPEEREQLRVHARGQRPTQETYYWALKMIRSMKARQ